MRFAMVIGAVVLALGAAPAAAADPGAVTVACFNIHAGAGEDGMFDLDRTADALRGLHADVIGLQEVDVHWDARSEYRDEARELARALGMHVFFAPIYDLEPAEAGAPRRQYGVAVLSRYPILAARNHEITRQSTLEPDAQPAPAPGFAEVTVAVRHRPVRVFATHLDHRADPAVRRTQVAEMLAILDRRPGPEVLTGDFNAEPGAPELGPLWTRLTDADPGAYTYPAVEPVKRIDFVTVSRDVAVREAHAPATTASDHRPVVARLALPR